jgi:hypothetical protein
MAGSLLSDQPAIYSLPASTLLLDWPALSYQFFDRPAFNCKLQCQFAKKKLSESFAQPQGSNCLLLFKTGFATEGQM